MYFSYAYFSDPLELPDIVVSHIEKTGAVLLNEKVEFSSQIFFAAARSSGCIIPEQVAKKPQFFVYERDSHRIRNATHIVALANGPLQYILTEVQEAILAAQFQKKQLNVLILVTATAEIRLRRTMQLRGMSGDTIVIKSFISSDMACRELELFLA